MTLVGCLSLCEQKAAIFHVSALTGSLKCKFLYPSEYKENFSRGKKTEDIRCWILLEYFPGISLNEKKW
jgi:hypothetical protein